MRHFNRLGLAHSATLALIVTAFTAALRGAEPLSRPPQLSHRVATDAGSAEAPLLFCIGMHIEPFGATPSPLVADAPRPPPRKGPSYEIPGFLRRQLADIRQVAEIMERHGGSLTIQVQSPFTRVLAASGEKLIPELAARGHEIALHFHEDAHLGRGSERLPSATWTAVLKEELNWLAQTGAPRIRYWSGGNLYPGVLEAAAAASLSVMSDYKNPRRQESDPRLLAIHPWRPAGGPAEDDLAAFSQHDPRGKIIYLPDGIFSRVNHAAMRRSAELGGDWKYFDSLTEGLEMSLRAARPDRVNVFHFTVHAGEFRGETGRPFAVIEAWLRDVLAPLGKEGKVRWATFSQMADAYATWERVHPGVDPRGESTRGTPNVASESRGADAASSSPATAPAATLATRGNPRDPARGFITFAVNVHDWRFVGDSADTLLRLIGLFEKHRVRGDFYVTAPIVQRYGEQRPEVIARLKQTGMTISYHVRAPHPLWRGFSEPLRDQSGDALAAVLRDYETFRLDLPTGALDRGQPGGYRYVEQVFGRRPVAVGTSDAAPPVKATSNRVYAELGVQVAVFHHETGTKPDQPFEWRDGLLVRPSDFSVTRFEAPGNPQGIFWWNMAGTPRAAEFDPVALLKKQLAAWSGRRPPFITALIHENDFYRQGGPGWNSIYFDGDGPQARPRQAPFDLDTPARSQPRPEQTRAAIYAKYEELVAYAAQQLSVVTSEDIATMAKSAPPPAARPAEPAGLAPRPISAK